MLQIKKLVFGLAAEVLLSCGLLALFSVLILKMGSLPNGIAGTMALAAGCISVLAAAFLTARMTGEKGLLHGLALAGVYIFLYLAVSLALYTDVDIASIGVRVVSLHFAARSAAFLALGEKVKFGFEIQGVMRPVSLCRRGFHNNIWCLYIGLHNMLYIKLEGLRLE